MATLPNDGSFTAHSPQVLNFLHELGKGGTSQSHDVHLDLLENESGGMETEISRLKEAVEKLEAEKEAGLAKFYNLLKKASFLESRIVSAEEESKVLKEQVSKYEGEKISCLQKKLHEAEDHARRVAESARKAGDEVDRLKKEVVKLDEEREVEYSPVLEKLGSLEKLMEERFTLEIERDIELSFVNGVACNAKQLLRKNAILEKEKELLISQVKELSELIDGLKCEFRQTFDDNEALVLEKSLLILLFEELKIEAAEAEKERKTLLGMLNNESRKILQLESKGQYLNENLRLKERNEHEGKLKLELEALNVEFSEVRESYQNLQTQMAKVVKENMVLKKDFAELKQQNLAFYEDLVHQSKSQLHEAEPNLVATQDAKLHGENSVEVLTYGNKCLSLEKRRNSEAVDLELLKKTAKLESIKTVEKTVDYKTTRFSTPDDMHTEIECDVPKTLAEESTNQYSCGLDDDRSVGTIQHMTPQKSYIGRKMSAPRWGLKIGTSTSKASSVSSDAQKDTSIDQIISNSKHPHYRKVDDKMGELWKTERGRAKKHKGRITDLGKKLHLKSYLPRSRSMSRDREGQQKSKRKGFWSCTQSPYREDSCHKVGKLKSN